MKKGVDSRQDVTAKLSVGFVGGEPVLKGQNGGVSVDADNKGLTPEILESILGNQYDPIMKAMIEHAGKIKGVHPVKKQMIEITKDPNLYQKYTKNLGDEERKDFAGVLADYKSLSPEVFTMMLPDLKNSKIIRLAVNPSTHPEILKKLLLADVTAKLKDDIREAVAKNPNTPQKILVKLANDDDPWIREAVAKNPSLPTEVLLKLANDSDEDVKTEIAHNPNTPPEALVKLANDDEYSVRAGVAKNPNTPPEALIKLADGPEIKIKLIVVKRSDTPPEALIKLADGPEIKVKLIVVKRTDTPPEALVKLANDGDSYIRRMVAKKPRTPPEVLMKLANDPDEDVRRVVRSNPSYKELNLQETNRKAKMTKDSLDKIIKEEYNTLLKERKMINYHISNKIPFSSNTFRIGSDSYFRVIKEARRLYKLGKLTPLNEMDKELFENSELGEWAIFEGERIPLDFPMYNEAKKKKDPPIGKPMKNTGGGKKYKVYVRNPKTGKIKKVTYGDSKGGLKGNWNNAEARKSFAARHKCAKKKDRTKPGYWACRAHKDFGTNVPGRFW
jgi:hypothetical protein